MCDKFPQLSVHLPNRYKAHQGQVFNPTLIYNFNSSACRSVSYNLKLSTIDDIPISHRDSHSEQAKELS